MVGHIFFGIFILILVFLVLSRWQAANGLIKSAGTFATGYTKTLQGSGQPA
jgi:hypothetical protein